VVAAVAVVVGLAAQAAVCGLSRDMVLIVAASVLALARPWLPGLPGLLGIMPPAQWVVPALSLVLTLGFAAWGAAAGQRFVTGTASMAAAIQGVAWAMTP
ncbi:MAG: hypothetical protein WCZ23_15725, partial [Rhodospirillaceae bacterium]